MTKRKSRSKCDRKRALVIREDASTDTVLDLLRSGRLLSIAAFTLTCIVLYALINVLPTWFTRPLNEHTASTLGLILDAFGLSAFTAGDVVSSGGLSFKIIPECTSIFTSFIFVIFVAFHPSSWRQKGTGLVWGIPALYLGNMIRLVVTFVMSRYDSRLFDVTHVFLGQVFTLFLLILCCILWMRWVENKETKKATSPDTTCLLARFGLISSVVFLVWLKLHHGYILLLDRMMAFGFSLLGRSVGLAHETKVYYETFSVVIAISLFFSVHSLSWRKKVPLLGAALGALFLINLFHRIDNALMVFFHITVLKQADLTLVVIGQYLVPVLVFLRLVKLQKQEVINANAVHRT